MGFQPDVEHTLSGETDAGAAIRDSGNLIDLEPNGTVSGPSVNIAWRLGHIDVNDARVVHGTITQKTELRARRNFGCRSGGLCLEV